MPPKQASLHAFFGGGRSSKRTRIEAKDVPERRDISTDDSGATEASLKDTQTQQASKRAQRNNPLDSHRFDPSDSSQREIRPHKVFENVVKPTNKQGPVKYTPLEQQILQLKKEHPGVLLLVEVGYKMKFYQEDARIASRVLNIVCEKANLGMFSGKESTVRDDPCTTLKCTCKAIGRCWLQGRRLSTDRDARLESRN